MVQIVFEIDKEKSDDIIHLLCVRITRYRYRYVYLLCINVEVLKPNVLFPRILK